MIEKGVGMERHVEALLQVSAALGAIGSELRHVHEQRERMEAHLAGLESLREREVAAHERQAKADERRALAAERNTKVLERLAGNRLAFLALLFVLAGGLVTLTAPDRWERLVQLVETAACD